MMELASNSTEPSAHALQCRYVTIKLAAKLTGMSAAAIRTKISRHYWVHGREYWRAPDGTIRIDLVGYDLWVTQKQEAAELAASELTVESLRSMLDYDPATGMFCWLKPGHKRTVGVWFQGTDNGAQYRTIEINGERYRMHRLAWFHVHGRWPDGVIDHINGDPSDNRIENLRETTPLVNAQNKVRTAVKKDGTASGVERRVSPKGRVSYRVRIMAAGKPLNVGSFATEAEAIAARDAAKLKHHAGYVPGRLPKPVSKG